MRITKRDLELSVDLLNDLTGSPTEPYTKNADGKYIANIGNYHLSGAYGGWMVQRMVNPGGGVNTPIGHGHVSKRECYETLRAFIRGVETAQSGNKE